MEPDTEFCYPNVIDFFGTTFFHLCHFTQVDLHGYKAYDKYTEDNLIKSNDILSNEVNRRICKSEEHHHTDIFESYSQDFNELQNIYPAMHRKAMIITLYNFFEHQIKTLCVETNRLLPQDLSGKYKFRNVSIKNFRQFLKKEASFKFEPGKVLWELWEDMLKVEQIRHVLVHSEGEIEKQRMKWLADIENYCKQKKSIRLIRHRIIIDEGYVASLITDLIRLFDLLYSDVIAFIRRYENVHGSYDVPLPPGASKIPL
ncbi:hypothetical protein [Citrobacter tructae]|uniref:Cthe-2314-like HEPN domain-containing protein n=1 Tax=Citrobacter tructae TaxID=2562449 RepID=A0ABX5T3T4_9ENTR|nr:hypothetical protein [Citrobacter tructae]QBX79983.1 hypothetical protein E4Z61_06240 [Citrobacter tructae]